MNWMPRLCRANDGRLNDDTGTNTKITMIAMLSLIEAEDIITVRLGCAFRSAGDESYPLCGESECVCVDVDVRSPPISGLPTAPYYTLF